MNVMFCHEAKVNMTGHLTLANKSNGLNCPAKRKTKFKQRSRRNVTKLEWIKRQKFPSQIHLVIKTNSGRKVKKICGYYTWNCLPHTCRIKKNTPFTLTNHRLMRNFFAGGIWIGMKHFRIIWMKIKFHYSFRRTNIPYYDLVHAE